MNPCFFPLPAIRSSLSVLQPMRARVFSCLQNHCLLADVVHHPFRLTALYRLPASLRNSMPPPRTGRVHGHTATCDARPHVPYSQSRLPLKCRSSVEKLANVSFPAPQAPNPSEHGLYDNHLSVSEHDLYNYLSLSEHDLYDNYL